MQDVLLNIGLLVLGLFLLMKAGTFVVRSLSAMARYLHFSEFVLSSLLLAFATSLPELTVGINAALADVSQLSLGDILGTNIANLALILGLVTVLGGGLKLKDYTHFKEGRIFTLITVLTPFAMLLDGVLSRMDGGILLILFAINLIRVLRERDMVVQKKTFRAHLQPHSAMEISTRKHFFREVLIFAVSVPLLLFGAQLLVLSAQNLSAIFNIPEFFIGLFIISVGTSLPELSVGLRSVLTHHVGVSLGDLFGSAVLNATLVLGIVALIAPIEAPSLRATGIAGIFTLAILLFIFGSLRKRNFLYKREGFLLLGTYALFLAIQFIAL